MEKVKIIIEDGKILIDCNGFEDKKCFTEVGNLLRFLEEKGVEVEIEKVEPKESETTGQGQNHWVRESQ